MAQNPSKDQKDVQGASGAEPVRRRITIPQVDTSTLAWWNAQFDPSASVRALIRAEIEREGLTDTVNRPVRQMPRRGRPPQEQVEQYKQAGWEFPEGTVITPKGDLSIDPASMEGITEVTASSRAGVGVIDVEVPEGVGVLLTEKGPDPAQEAAVAPEPQAKVEQEKPQVSAGPSALDDIMGLG